MTPCPQCGTEPPAGALFCPTCGTRVPPGGFPGQGVDSWDTARPALPDDLFRRPTEEPAPPAPDPEVTAVRPASLPLAPPPAPDPTWSYAPGTPEADLLPSERLATAPPRPVQRGFTGARGVIILLVLLVVAAVIGGVLWFSGGQPQASGSRSPSATSSTSSSPASTSHASSTTSSSASSPSSGPPTDAFPPAGATLCAGSDTVAVNATTSCEFAANVAAAIPTDATGSFVVTAHSPVTNKDYEMSCQAGTYTVCTGGVNAIVYVK